MKSQILLATVLLMLGACASTDYDPYVAATENQLATRSYQTRDFTDVEYPQLMQAMIGTLQDYHFRIREVDTELGTITAFQHTRGAGSTELTIFIKSSATNQHTVRINMLTGLKVENEPGLYQKFFAAVRKQLHYQGNA
jgi:hypothetical protein